ncbi:alpha/beta hydrolase [Enterococcus rivorum]|uniref:Alpha/beta hydrolase n=1 Tax=Enterococcus rivorum TaxID=762845 RepID=A0A1E5KV36_9ENTE|nr:alpha/beta hydrolase [Enterococcus rivorum]MBP2100398.1 surfactin synthase thioesterase subunit [Enterococcus rivorum]OEH81700.1 alpha/beta hydrolase [Enterococcus rivorum]
MIKRILYIEGIPAVLWGPKSNHVFIAVHGDQSNKEDDIIKLFAEVAVNKGYQVLSFDLPEHGDRKIERTLCTAQNSVKDLVKIVNYVSYQAVKISVFGCSIGAYFSMLAYKDELIQQALFLSPVVDMKRIIFNMMMWFNISEERLKKDQKVVTPIKTLYWDYYEYVLIHPLQWHSPTKILYGAKDELCEEDFINQFVEKTSSELTILEEGEHFFHSQEQLTFFEKWLERSINGLKPSK